MFQVTPLDKLNAGKQITDGEFAIKIKNIVYPTLLKLAKTKVKYKIVRDNGFNKIDGHPIIIVANHTRFQDTPIVCQVLKDVLDERGYIFAGKQNLSFLDNIFFYLYGSIFVDRKKKEDMATAQQAMERYLEIGKPVIVFPEATWNMSPELLMLPMKWGIIKSAQRKDAQIIPMILEYDTEKKECHVSFEEPRLIAKEADIKEEIEDLRNVMAARRFSYILKHPESRNNINIAEEHDRIYSVVREYPNYDYDYEQSCVYQPHTTPEEVFAPVKKLTPNKQNAFLFNKRISG